MHGDHSLIPAEVRLQSLRSPLLIWCHGIKASPSRTIKKLFHLNFMLCEFIQPGHPPPRLLAPARVGTVSYNLQTDPFYVCPRDGRDGGLANKYGGSEDFCCKVWSCDLEKGLPKERNILSHNKDGLKDGLIIHPG